MALIVTTHFIFGVPTDEQLSAPFANLPEGARVRWRFRAREFARCFVKTANGIAEYSPEFINGKWHLNEEFRQGLNLRVAA